ncbi:MAG: PIN domain-containing protein [Nanoarchaeota archaeon]
MKIVIDSNRIVAALLKDSTTREILLNKKFEFIAPSYVFSEIDKHKDYIIKKAKIHTEEFKTLLSFIFENIKIIPELEYKEFIKKFEKEIKDYNDVPYLALSSATGAKGIWTHDAHFKEQSKVKIYTNMDLLKFVNKEE